MHIIRDVYPSARIADTVVGLLVAFAGPDLTREQANRVLKLWVGFPTLQPGEVTAILRCFPVGAS